MRFMCLLVMGLLLTAFSAQAMELPDADEYHKASYPRINDKGKPEGEQYAWHVYFYASNYWKGYLITKDERWIKNAIQAYDHYLSRNKLDPDGYYGTFGAGFDSQKTKDFQYRWDTVVGDSIQCMPIVRLAEIILADPGLKAKYGDKANEYVEYAHKMCFEKWNKRGCAYEDAAGYVSYRTYEKQLDPKTNKWVDTPNSVISDNLNKHYDMAAVLMRLYRITGKQEYKDRCFAIFSRAKRMLRYFPEEDRVVWNFWMPHGPYDLKGTAPASWVGVHSYRAGYQNGEMSIFQEAYDTGIVFDKQDMQRMLNTNLWMRTKANYKISADGTTKAGQLWNAMSRFSDEVYDDRKKSFSGKNDIRNKIAYHYMEYMREFGWDRKYLDDSSKEMIYDFQVEPGVDIRMATVIPNTLEIANGDRIKMISALHKSAPYKVELLDKSGKVLGTLHEEEFKTGGSTYKTIIWDGTNPKTGKKETGDFTARFTLGDESRTWPLRVITGTKKAGEEKFTLKSGESIGIDFESPLNDEHTKLSKEPEILDGKGRDGSKGLQLKSGQSIAITFGEYDPLKVKVTMWVYDDGKKVGRKNGSGGLWGVTQETGNKFAIWRMWRKYLNGDGQYIWLNNGENQWFTPHQTSMKRSKGWHKWVFDMTGEKMVISCDDQVMSDKDVAGKWEFIPTKGAIGAFAGGPGHNMPPIFVDDILIEYP